MVSSNSSDDAKRRHLRALYRQHRPQAQTRGGLQIISQADTEAQWSVVQAEYEHLYGEPSRDGTLEHIIKDVWREERQLRGETYDYGRQAWVDRDGNKVLR